ncbi:DUF1127 domain-containing protein [Tabrizicola sp.]|uniref:DUF1127 domain-containing protein n=1 Tax=Tabrizicola sp. TaxID=2005166 RepID=UPI003F314E36
MPQSHIQTLPLRRPTGLVARITRFVVQASARRRDRAQLGNLDLHLLHDIGLTRDEAQIECAKPFWQP